MRGSYIMQFYAEILPSGEIKVLTFETPIANDTLKVTSLKIGEVIPRELKLVSFSFRRIKGEGSSNRNQRRALWENSFRSICIYSDDEIHGRAQQTRIDGTKDYLQARCSEAFERRTPLETEFRAQRTGINKNTIISDGIITVIDISVDTFIAMHKHITFSEDTRKKMEESDKALRNATPAGLIPGYKVPDWWVEVLRDKESKLDRETLEKELRRVTLENDIDDQYIVPEWWRERLNDVNAMNEYCPRLLSFAKDNFSKDKNEHEIHEIKEKLEAVSVNQNTHQASAGPTVGPTNQANAQSSNEVVVPLILHLHSQQQAISVSLTELTGQQPGTTVALGNVDPENVGSHEEGNRKSKSNAFI